MLRSIRTLLESWNKQGPRFSAIALIVITLLASGCQNRAPSLRMLDTRAGYMDEIDDEEVALYQRARKSSESLVHRGGPRVASVYIYPHDLPTRDRFWGGYVSMLIADEEVVFENPEADDSDAPAAIREIKKKKAGKK